MKNGPPIVPEGGQAVCDVDGCENPATCFVWYVTKYVTKDSKGCRCWSRDPNGKIHSRCDLHTIIK